MDKIDVPLSNDNYTLLRGTPLGAVQENTRNRGHVPYDCERGVHLMVADTPLVENGRARARAYCVACPYEAIQPWEQAAPSPKVALRQHSTLGNATAYKMPGGRTLIIGAGPNRATRRRKGAQ